MHCKRFGRNGTNGHRWSMNEVTTGKIDFKEYVAWERRRDLQKWFEQERKRQEPLPGKSGSKMGSGLGPGSIP